MPNPNRRERGIFKGFCFHIERTEPEEFHRLRNLIIGNDGRIHAEPYADRVTHLIVFTPNAPHTLVDMTAYQRSNTKTYSDLLSGTLKWSTDELINTFARRQGMDVGPREGKTVLKAEWIDICVERMSPVRMDNYLGMEIMVQASAPPAPITRPILEAKPQPAQIRRTSLASRISTLGDQSSSRLDAWSPEALSSRRRSPSPQPDRRERYGDQREMVIGHHSRRTGSPVPTPLLASGSEDRRDVDRSRERVRSPIRRSERERERPHLRENPWRSPIRARSPGTGRDDRRHRRDTRSGLRGSPPPVSERERERYEVGDRPDRISRLHDARRDIWHSARESGSDSRWSRDALAAKASGRERELSEASVPTSSGGLSRSGQPSLLARAFRDIGAGTSSTAPPVIIPPDAVPKPTLRAPIIGAPRVPPSTSTAPSAAPRPAPPPPSLTSSFNHTTSIPARSSHLSASGNPFGVPKSLPRTTSPLPLPNIAPPRRPAAAAAPASATGPTLARFGVPVSPATRTRGPFGLTTRPPSAVLAVQNTHPQPPSSAAVTTSASAPTPQPSSSLSTTSTAAHLLPKAAETRVPAAVANAATGPVLDLSEPETAVKAEPDVVTSATPTTVKPAQTAVAELTVPSAPAPVAPPTAPSFTLPPDLVAVQIKAEPPASATPVLPPADKSPTLPSATPVLNSQVRQGTAGPAAADRASHTPIVKQEKRAGDASQPITIDSDDDDNAPITLRAAKHVKQEGKKEVKRVEQPAKAGPSAPPPARKAVPPAKPLLKPIPAAGPSVKPRKPGQTTARPRPAPISIPKPKTTTGPSSKPSTSASNRPTFSKYASSSKIPSSSNLPAEPSSSPDVPVIGTKRARQKRRIEDSSEEEDDVPLSAGRKKKAGTGDIADRRKEKADERRTSAGPSHRRNAGRARHAEATPPNNARYPSPAPTPVRQVDPARADSAGLSAPGAGLSNIFVNLWGTPVTFHVVMDAEGLLFLIPAFVKQCGGQLVDMSAATFIIIPRSPGPILTTEISSLLDQESINLCSGKILVSFHYIRDCKAAKKMLNIEGYEVVLVAPPAAAMDEEEQECGEERGRKEIRGMRTPDSIGDKPSVPILLRAKREQADMEEASEESEESSGEEGSESEYEGEDDGVGTGKRATGSQSRRSRSSAAASSKVVSPSGRESRGRRNPGKKVKRAQPDKDTKPGAVRKDDRADYAWLKSKFLAWDGDGDGGGRTKFLEDLSKEDNKRSWVTLYMRYRDKFEAEVPALQAYVRGNRRV